jgi:hypothetical protein
MIISKTLTARVAVPCPPAAKLPERLEQRLEFVRTRAIRINLLGSAGRPLDCCAPAGLVNSSGGLSVNAVAWSAAHWRNVRGGVPRMSDTVVVT